MRSSVADFEVIDSLPASPEGRARYVCRAPERFAGVDRVMVSEVAVDASGWAPLVERLTRWTAAGSDGLLRLLEAGPDLDSSGAGVYLVSELPTGGHLGARSDALESVRAVAAAARGAHALHEAGLAHGSIDGTAIFVTDHGAVLGPPPLDVEPGLVCRVRDWRSFVTVDPSLLAGEAPNRSSDIWSLGASLHVALSDRPPFKGIESDEPVTAVQRMLFTRPELDPDLPPVLAAAISVCLNPDPIARPSTAMELADRLAAAEGSL